MATKKTGCGSKKGCATKCETKTPAVSAKKSSVTKSSAKKK